MAAIELPLNDQLTSNVWEARNARKAQQRAQSAHSFARSSSSRLAPISGASYAMSTTSAPAAGAAPGTITDNAVLAQYPPSLVRLLVLLAPTIHACSELVRLTTWTGGPGTASRSFSLLFGWWLVCLYGYEFLRYGPQIVVLGFIGFSGLQTALNKSAAAGSITATRSTSTATALNETLDELAMLADFVSTLKAELLIPLVQLLTWKKGPTKPLAIFLITTWPIWLLCFSPVWQVAGLPSVAIRLGGPLGSAQRFILEVVRPVVHEQVGKAVPILKAKAPPAVLSAIDKAHSSYLHSRALYELYAAPVLVKLVSIISAILSPMRRGTSNGAALTLIPPWPLFSLTLRHAFLFIGSVALTWCSPWAALIRQALWRSAMVRRSVRSLVSLLSGQGLGSSRHSLFGFVDDDEDHFALAAASTPLGDKSTAASASASVSSAAAASAAAAAAKKGGKQANPKVKRYEDVIYQFTVFENQRWWMGLDWTAALLPQERPSWSDESNNPVSPPSSFTLPAPRLTLKPSPTSSNPEAYTKRLVKWQWIDREWKVAGRDGIEDLGQDVLSASRTEAEGTLYERSVGGSGGADGGELIADGDEERVPALNPSSIAMLEVDAEGWQYSDNAWERVSRKGGMGKYTRRRRWVRRAVLVEVVEVDYLPTEEEKRTANAAKGELKLTGDAPTLVASKGGASVGQDAEKQGGGDLQARLAQAAA